MKNKEVVELIEMMGYSIQEKVTIEADKLFYKMVLFVSFNNLALGMMVWLLT